MRPDGITTEWIHHAIFEIAATQVYEGYLGGIKLETSFLRQRCFSQQWLDCMAAAFPSIQYARFGSRARCRRAGCGDRGGLYVRTARCSRGVDGSDATLLSIGLLEGGQSWYRYCL